MSQIFACELQKPSIWDLKLGVGGAIEELRFERAFWDLNNSKIGGLAEKYESNMVGIIFIDT